MNSYKNRGISLIFRLLLPLLFVAVTTNATAQSVTFNKTWVEYDVEKNGTMGINFHFDFVVHDYYGQQVKAVVFVSDSKNGWMKSYRKDYETTTGKVCTSKTIKCDYENTRWSDLKLFVPYNAMELAENGVTYSYCIAIRKTDDSDIKQDVNHTFDWNSYSPTATINKIWVDHNQMQGDKKGMMIHADLQVNNNKGNKTNFVCFFYDDDGKSVISSDLGYQTSSLNHLVTFDDQTPSYKNSQWKDFKLFIPYSTFPYIQGTTSYSFKFFIRDISREYRILANSESQYFTVSFGNNNTQCDKPVLAWMGDYSSSSSSFNVRIGVESKTDVSQSSLTVNGSTYRGMKAVHNDGYKLSINEIVHLKEGDNEIVATATNSCGTTTQTYHVTYTPRKTDIVQTQNRVALVIGNSKYYKNPLDNPANDASDVSTSLRSLGFDVKTIINGTKQEMNKAISELSSRGSAGGVVLFYYAGHGIQKDGRNYLIPVDVELRSAADIEYECTDVGRVLSNMELSGCTMNILVLDACRDNPFERSWSRSSRSSGLSTVNAPKGTFIAYATSPGNVANDGQGRNSPYTKAFLQTLQVPGLSLFDFFQQVQSTVMRETGDTQIPWVSSSFVGKFYFNAK